MGSADPFSFFMGIDSPSSIKNIEDVFYIVTIRYNDDRNEKYNLTLKPIFVDIPKP